MQKFLLTQLGKFHFSCAKQLYFLIIQKIIHLIFLKSVQSLFKFFIMKLILNTDKHPCIKLIWEERLKFGLSPFPLPFSHLDFLSLFYVPFMNPKPHQSALPQDAKPLWH